VEGQVRWDNLNPDGKEFIQSIIEPGDSFGDIPLFDDQPYAANAVANQDSVILCLPKPSFRQLLAENPAVHLCISRNLAKQLRLKFLLLKTIALENPEIIIRTVLQQEKCKQTPNGHRHFPVNLTRQQIANMTGLRVETVIRTIRHMSDTGQLEINHGKVFLGV
jgi:CRP/FNR family transcriptional regulator, cyclic AMP receptor protein